MANNENNLSYLKSLVRERDMDRYLTILLSQTKHQSALFGLAALNAELAYIPEMTKEPGLSAIRYQWWRDGFSGDVVDGALGEGVKTGNPVVDDVNAMLIAHDLPHQKVIDLIDRYEEFEHAPRDGDDAKLLAVDAPIFELTALVLGGGTAGTSEESALENACEAAALSLAAAKFRKHDGLARLNARECTVELANLDSKTFAAVFDAFLPVSLVDFYLKSDPDSPSHQLKRIWTLWRAHRKHSLGAGT